MAENNSSTKVVTDLVRFSYLHVFEPVAMEEGQDKKYSVSLIIPKSNTKLIAKIKQAIEVAKEAGKTSKFGGKIPQNLKQPLRDGDVDRPEDEAYANSYFITASAKTKPGLVDKDLNPILDQDELYSGCYGRASINFYPYNAGGGKGVAAGLNNLQKVKDGEPLSGRSKPEEDFADTADSSDEDFG